MTIWWPSGLTFLPNPSLTCYTTATFLLNEQILHVLQYSVLFGALYLQSVHLNLVPLWTDFMCLWRLPFLVNVDSQWVHGNFWPSWTDFMCVWRLVFWVNEEPHCGQKNFWPSSMDFMCVWRLFWRVALYLDCRHWNFLPSFAISIS